MILTGSLCLIILSHTRIISSILRVPSASGRQKALSTCGSHLTVVFLFYGMTIGVYLCPPSSHSGDEYRHCSDTDSEPLHLQPQEQGYEGGIEQAFGNSHTVFSGTLLLNPYFAVSLCRTHVFIKEYHPLLYWLMFWEKWSQNHSLKPPNPTMWIICVFYEWQVLSYKHWSQREILTDFVRFLSVYYH